MKHTIEFKLPEEKDELEMAMHAIDYYIVLTDLDDKLRAKIKYAAEDVNELTIAAYEEIREYLHGLAKDRNIEI